MLVNNPHFQAEVFPPEDVPVAWLPGHNAGVRVKPVLRKAAPSAVFLRYSVDRAAKALQDFCAVDEYQRGGRRLASTGRRWGEGRLFVSRILVADDHPFFRLGVDAVLQMGGHEVVAMTGDGDATLEAIEREDPEIVLLDVRMPGRDGISTLRALRERRDERPVIILTVELTDNQLLEALRARVNGIVFKHDAEENLLKAIDAVKNGLRYVDGKLIDKAVTQAGLAGSPSRLGTLTRKEREVAEHVARGLRNRDIAALMTTTEGTVKVYLHSIYTKLGISNRTELAMIRMNEPDE